MRCRFHDSCDEQHIRDTKRVFSIEFVFNSTLRSLTLIGDIFDIFVEKSLQSEYFYKPWFFWNFYFKTTYVSVRENICNDVE